MKKIVIFLLVLTSSIVCKSQTYCIPDRFDTTDFFLDSQIDTAVIQYGQNFDWVGVSTNLFLNCYYPSLTPDALDRRPLVVLIHGGSFRNGSRYDLRQEALYFARKGYVSATVDYRMGWVGTNPADCWGNNSQHIDAVYRTVQDVKAAIRYLCGNAAIYRIDTNAVFVGGTSAGAFASLGIGFISEDEFETEKPGIVSILGRLDSASNTYYNSSKILGLLAYKAAMWDTSAINEDAIPVIFIHGTADPYYPYLSGTAYTCPNYFQMMGSGLLSQRLDHLGMCYELNYMINGNHGDFYTASYTLGRRALFMKKILCDQCNVVIVENQVIISDTLIVGVSEDEMGTFTFTAFPNPTTDHLSVTYDTPGEFSYEIYNAAMQRKMVGSFTSGSYINTELLDAGIYVFVIYNKQGSIIERIKLIKQ